MGKKEKERRRLEGRTLSAQQKIIVTERRRPVKTHVRERK